MRPIALDGHLRDLLQLAAPASAARSCQALSDCFGAIGVRGGIVCFGSETAGLKRGKCRSWRSFSIDTLSDMAKDLCITGV